MSWGPRSGFPGVLAEVCWDASSLGSPRPVSVSLSSCARPFPQISLVSTSILHPAVGQYRPSRLCKAAMLQSFRKVAQEMAREDLVALPTYHEAKVSFAVLGEREREHACL